MAAEIPLCVCGCQPVDRAHTTLGRVRWAATISCRNPTCLAHANGTGATQRKARKVALARWLHISAERRAKAHHQQRTDP